VGQLWVAVFEIALAAGFLSEHTGYPDAYPMAVAFACITVLSAAWRAHTVLLRRRWVEAQAQVSQ
jgi:hypothetical protein